MRMDEEIDMGEVEKDADEILQRLRDEGYSRKEIMAIADGIMEIASDPVKAAYWRSIAIQNRRRKIKSV